MTAALASQLSAVALRSCLAALLVKGLACRDLRIAGCSVRCRSRAAYASQAAGGRHRRQQHRKARVRGQRTGG